MKKYLKLSLIFLLYFTSISIYAQNISNRKCEITGTLIDKSASNKLAPFIKGTFENEDLWIDIIPLCTEGNIVCDNVIYIGVDKNTGNYIVLKGKGFLDKNNNFKEYVFSNNEYNYTISINNYLYISRKGKIIKEVKLNDIK